MVTVSADGRSMTVVAEKKQGTTPHEQVRQYIREPEAADGTGGKANCSDLSGITGTLLR
jgi:hypothetical protein